MSIFNVTLDQRVVDLWCHAQRKKYVSQKATTVTMRMTAYADGMNASQRFALRVLELNPNTNNADGCVARAFAICQALWRMRN